MNFLFINPPIRTWAKPNIAPMGIAYVAASLEKQGHNVKVFDINAYRYDEEYVEHYIEYIIGFNQVHVIALSGLLSTYKYVKWLVSIIRKYDYYSKIKIIVGGALATSATNILLENTDVDAVIIGEGDNLTEKDLIECFNNPDTRKIKLDIVKDLDTLPMPARHLLPMDIYTKNGVGGTNVSKWSGGNTNLERLSASIVSSRSCCYNCIYCLKDFFGGPFRQRSAKNVIKEIEHLFLFYGVTYFHFLDDMFALNKKFVQEFCDEMIYLKSYYKTDFTWGGTYRVNLVDEETLKLMKDAGCVHISFGIESGNQEMLDFIKKGVTVEQASKAVKLAKKYIEDVDCSFMIGYPNESLLSIADTLIFCAETEIDLKTLFFITPYPGTELFQYTLDKGLVKYDEDYILALSDNEQGKNILVNMTKFSDEKLYELQKGMLEVGE